MKAVLFYDSAPDVMEKAPLYFAGHKARADLFHSQGKLLAVGTWADPREGAMGVFASRQAAEEFVQGDPFWLNGVVSSYRVRDWNETLISP